MAGVSGIHADIHGGVEVIFSRQGFGKLPTRKAIGTALPLIEGFNGYNQRCAVNHIDALG